MSKEQERLRSELLSEDKITNPGGWSICRVKNLSPQIRILVTHKYTHHLTSPEETKSGLND
jgi:hypothetical protein